MSSSSYLKFGSNIKSIADYDEILENSYFNRVEQLLSSFIGDEKNGKDFVSKMLKYLEDISRKNEYFKQFRADTYEMDAMLKIYLDWYWNRNKRDIKIPSQTKALSLEMSMKNDSQSYFRPCYDAICNRVKCLNALCNGGKCHCCIHQGFNKYKNFTEVKPDIFVECYDSTNIQNKMFAYMKPISFRKNVERFAKWPKERTKFGVKFPDVKHIFVPKTDEVWLVGEVGASSEWHMKMVQLERVLTFVCVNAMFQCGDKSYLDAPYGDGYRESITNYIGASVLCLPMKECKLRIRERLDDYPLAFPHLYHLATIDRLYFCVMNASLNLSLANLSCLWSNEIVRQTEELKNLHQSVDSLNSKMEKMFVGLDAKMEKMFVGLDTKMEKCALWALLLFGAMLVLMLSMINMSSFTAFY